MFHFALSPLGLGVLAVAGGTLVYKRYGKTRKAGEVVSNVVKKGASLFGLTVERSTSDNNEKPRPKQSKL